MSLMGKIEEAAVPSHDRPGRILFQLVPAGPLNTRVRSHVFVHDWDEASAVYFIHTGMRIPYFLNTEVLTDQPNGYYVLEGVVGKYQPGEYGLYSEFETFSWDSLRQATPIEAFTQELIKT